MKKTIWLIFLVLAIGFLIFYLRTWAPFMAISGKSMEPELKVGDFVLIEQVSPREVKEGDVIVFEIPTLVREHYNYPLLIAHRKALRSKFVILELRFISPAFIWQSVCLSAQFSIRVPHARLLGLLFWSLLSRCLTCADGNGLSP